MTASGGGVERAGARFSVELSGGSGPITGFITAEGATPREFSGWIQLTELIEAQRLKLAGNQQQRKGTSNEW